MTLLKSFYNSLIKVFKIMGVIFFIGFVLMIYRSSNNQDLTQKNSKEIKPKKESWYKYVDEAFILTKSDFGDFDKNNLSTNNYKIYIETQKLLIELEKYNNPDSKKSIADLTLSAQSVLLKERQVKIPNIQLLRAAANFTYKDSIYYNDFLTLFILNYKK